MFFALVQQSIHRGYNRPHEQMMRFSQDDDDFAAARGLLLGVVLGLALWVIATVVVAVVVFG